MIRLKKLLVETLRLKPQDVPQGIKLWARKVSGGNIQTFELDQSGQVRISMPWHVSDKVIYQKFKLLPNGDVQPYGDTITRVGWEADSPQGAEDAERKSGVMEIPEGHLVVAYGTYPKRIEIYAGKGSEKMLPSAEDVELDLTQVYALAAAKQLKPFARPKFREEVYQTLIDKGLMNKNKSITVDGRNLFIQSEKIRELLKQAIEIYRKKTHSYSPVQPETSL